MKIRAAELTSRSLNTHRFATETIDANDSLWRELLMGGDLRIKILKGQ